MEISLTFYAMSHEARVPFVLARRQFLQRIPFFVNESDPCSNVRYLSSIENKARKKLRPVRDLNP